MNLIVHSADLSTERASFILWDGCVRSESSVRSKREKHDLEYKKKVLSLAKQHRSASDMEKVDRYFMPADDKVCSL